MSDRTSLQKTEDGATPHAGQVTGRIVWADDKDDMREYVARLLGEAGFEVIAVADGKAALDAVREDPPDLVLADIMMPRLDGLGLMRALRAEQATARIPIILLSARAEEEARIEGMQAGADDYLTKPFSAPELLARVKSQIRIASLRREADQAKQESDHHIRAFADAAPVMLWVTEPDGTATFLSRSWYEYTGQTEDEAMGLGWLDAVHPDDKEASGNIFLQANERHEPFSLDYRLRRALPDGKSEYRWCIDSGRPRFDSDGEFLGYAGAVFDVHDRKQAEEALRASEERLRGIFTQTLAGVAETDLTGRFVQVNQRYCEIVGRTAEELYGLRMQDITHPDDLTRNLPLFKRAVTEGVPFNIEKRYVRPDGSLVWVNNSVSLIRDENGTPKHIAAVSLEVSERKQAEEGLTIRSRQQRAVAALGQFALSEPELKNVFDEAVRIVADTLGNEYCKVLELLPGGDQVLLVSGVGWKQGLVGKATVPTDLESQAGYTLVSEGPVISRDLRIETRFRGPQLLIDHGVISGMSCIIAGAPGKPWGVLGTHTTQERQFTEDDVNFLVAVANVVSNAIRRSQQEGEVRRSAETFAALVEQSPLGIYTVDADFRIANVSAGAAPAFRNVQPVIGRDFAEVMHTIWPEPFASEVLAIFRRVLETGEPYVSPGLTEKRKDIGEIESYEWQVNRVILADGRPGVVCYYFDATRLQKANQAVQESEARFRAMADNIPQLAWMADGEGWIFWYNQRWYDYTGTNLEQMQGWGWKSVHHPDHLERVVEKVARHFREGLVWEDTFPLRGRDGQYRWFLSRMTPIRDASGKVVLFFGTNTDVTEQLAAEEGLREADRRKNEFLAILAHELRNPLAPIRNAVQVLRLTRGDGEALASASEMMERQVGQLVRLVDDLLDVSRISRGKIELRKERVELQSIVHHAVEAARPVVQRMNHDLQVTLSSQPIYLNADPTRLTQVVGNLLSNACKFTDKGGCIWLTVEVASAAESEPRNEAVIRVRDSGVGITSDQLPRIFEMFTQVDTSLERTQTGLGIGLTLVRKLVEMHGGTVEVHSGGVGQGSEFVVRLPILIESAPLPLEPTASEPTTQAARRILVVDDNRDSATSLAMLLQMVGHQTYTAYDGLEAVETAAMSKPDVVLLDIGLPKLNGYEACRRIREQPGGREMVLVALTGWGQEEDRQRSKEAGFDGHLVKPVDLAVLMKLLAEVDD